MVIKNRSHLIQYALVTCVFHVFSVGFLFNVAFSQPVKKMLSVGDQAPGIKVYDWIKGDPISVLKKDRVYILEFGATWCKPCGMLIPKLSTLSQKYRGQVSVASFFVMEEKDDQISSSGDPKYVTRVKGYVKKSETKIDYSVAVDTKEMDMEVNWLQAAGKIGLPHIFLVDKNGVIAWIGSDIAILEQEVNKVLAPGYITSVSVQDNTEMQYDPTKLLLIDGNGGGNEDFLFRSLLTKYDGKIRTPPPLFVSSFIWAEGGSEDAKYQRRIQATGATLMTLYQLAYGDTLWNQVSTRTSSGQFVDTVMDSYSRSVYGRSWFEPILEVADKTPFIWSYRSPNNKFNYSLKVPDSRSSAKYMQKIMQGDLKNYFGYDVSVEYRMMPVWKLKAGPKAKDVLKTKSPGAAYKRQVDDDGTVYFKNASTRDIISSLGTFFGYGMLDYGRLPKGDVGPFIDETNINYEIDFYLGVSDRDNFSQFNEYLKSVGLYLVKEMKQMKVVVIRDSRNYVN